MLTNNFHTVYKSTILCTLWFQVCVATIQCSNRQQRILHFPDKTNVVMTMSLLKLLPSESIINTLTEYDVLFPVPLHPYKSHSRIKREIDRNVIYEKLKTIMNILSLREEYMIETFINDITKSLEAKSNDTDDVFRDIVTILFK